MKRYANGPLIAALTSKHRMTVNETMRLGRYGPTFEHRKLRYADLAAVEQAEGVTFSDEQITQATAGYPLRLLTIPENEEIYGAEA